MKKEKFLLRLIAAALVLCMTAAILCACGSSATVMTVTVDGKSHTLSSDEMDVLMRVKKLEIACSLLLTRSYDTVSYWAKKTDDDVTYEDYYNDIVYDQLKAILVEKYLFDLYDLSISKDKLDTYKTQLNKSVKEMGGKGSYKQYWGYTPSEYYDVYMMAVARSEAVLDYLCGENGINKVTAEDLEAYYLDNFVGYQFIMLDMKNKVKRDEDDNRIVKTEKDKDGKEVESDEYETEAITDEKEKEEKQLLPDVILKELENGADFRELIDKYSDDYYSVTYSDGWFINKESTFINSTLTKAVKELEIGEYTTEAVTVNTNYKYIVKRVELKEKVYEDEKYLEIFENYEDTVKYDKYENLVEVYFDKIAVNEDKIKEYSIADTYLSKYADAYYQQYIASLYGGLS